VRIYTYIYIDSCIGNCGDGGLEEKASRETRRKKIVGTVVQLREKQIVESVRARACNRAPKAAMVRGER